MGYPRRPTGRRNFFGRWAGAISTWPYIWHLPWRRPSSSFATFFVNPADAKGSGTSFTELPGSLHGRAGGMAFADGHSELHKWNGGLTTQLFDPNRTGYLQAVNVSGDPASQGDLTWLAMHTPQH